MNLRPTSIALLLLCFFIAFSSCDINQADFADEISVNSGSTGASAARNGRQWLGDVRLKNSLSMQLRGLSAASTAFRKPSSADPVPHKTARITRSQFSYTFQLNPGQKIIRLHFNPSPYRGFKGFRDFFTVEAGPFILLANFSVSLTADAAGLNTLVKEFYLNIEENQPLTITFSPESNQLMDTYAFVNGIEIISVPVSLSYFNGGEIGLRVVGQNSLVFFYDSTALEIVHRLNIKPDLVPATGDFDSVFPKWATQSGDEVKNKTWKMPAEVGFRYLIRLHLSKVGLRIAEAGDLKYKILINDVIVHTNAEMVNGRGKENIVLYRDYIVVMKGRKQSGRRNISISLHSFDELADGHGVLAGFEIVKLSNTDDILASPNPLPPVQESKSYAYLLSFLNHPNASGTVAVTILSLLCTIVHTLREVWEANSPEEEQHKPSENAESWCSPSFVGQKSPFKLTSSMLQGQALKSMEDVTYSELLVDIQDDQKFESTAGLLGAHDFPPQEQGEVKENGPVETSAPSDRYYPVIDNDSAVIDGTSDYVERERDLSQPQSRAAFRMSALEDFVDLDDDPTCNGVASRPFSEGRGSAEAHSISTAKQFSPPEEPKVLEPAIQPELKSPLDLLSSKTNKVSSSVAGAVSLGKGSNGIITLASEEVTAAALPTVPPSVASFNKPKEINNPSSIFSFSSKVEDKFPSLVPESSSIPESSSSLLDVSAPASSPSKVVDPEKGGFLKPLAAEDTSRNFDTVATAASNGPLVSGAPAVSFAATSNNNNAHQISTAAPAIFTPSVSVSDCIPSGSGSMSSTTSSGLIFGAAEAPKGLGEPAFKFGVSPDPSAKVSAVSTTSGPTFKFGVSHDPSAKVSEASITIPPVGDLKNNALTNLSSGITTSSSTKFVAFGAPSSGDMTPGFSSSTNISSGNNSQGSLFSSENKSFPPIAGNVSQGTSAQSFSLAPQSTANSSPSFVPTIPSSQVSSPTISFGLNSSASSADAGAVVSNSGPTSSLFGANPSALSNGSAGGSSSFTTSPFSFGFGSSSSATNMIESTGGTTASGFSFGASPSGPSPATITIGSTIGTTTSGFSFGASSSCSSPATNTVGSTGSTTSSSFSFGASPSASSPATNTIGSIGATTAPGFSFGAASSPATNTIGSTGATTSGFSFGMSSSASPPATNTIGSTGATNASGFSFGASSTGSAPTTTSFFSTSPSTGAVGSTGGTTASGFSFGVSSSGSAPAPTSIFSGASSSANAIGSTGGAMPVFGFGLSPASTSASNGASPFSNGASSVFQFGGSSSSSFSAINSTISSNPPPNAFGSSLQAPTSSVFGSSPATGFSFGATATSSAPINSAPTVFGATATSSSSPFSFTSSSVFSSPSPTPVFGNAAPAFAAPTSPGNNFQMNGEDSMAEDPVQSTAPPVAVFGGQASFPPAPGFMPGPSVPSQPNPFQFGGQPNQGVPQNPFQASGEFNAGGGSFSLGSGGDKAGRKYVKANRNKNRKK